MKAGSPVSSQPCSHVTLAHPQRRSPPRSPSARRPQSSLNVRHSAPTPVGARVRAVATYLGPAGKLFRFRGDAVGEAGAIGDGEHVRAIVARERLLGGAARRTRWLDPSRQV